MQILQQQYLLTQRARDAMLDFVENAVGNRIISPQPAFNNKSIRDLLVHNAGCYFDWIDHFAFRKARRLFEARDYNTMPEIRRLYREVDGTVKVFLQRFGDNLEERISGDPIAWGPGSATALEVFTHVMTHEFHHKGQVLLMCRHLGHVPPDTDMSIAFSDQ